MIAFKGYKKGLRSHFFSHVFFFYVRAIAVGIHLSLLSNLFWFLKTTLAVGYHLYYLLRGIFRIYDGRDVYTWELCSGGGRGTGICLPAPKTVEGGIGGPYVPGDGLGRGAIIGPAYPNKRIAMAVQP
jgi:hypothetical protein